MYYEELLWISSATHFDFTIINSAWKHILNCYLLRSQQEFSTAVVWDCLTEDLILVNKDALSRLQLQID